MELVIADPRRNRDVLPGVVERHPGSLVGDTPLDRRPLPVGLPRVGCLEQCATPSGVIPEHWPRRESSLVDSQSSARHPGRAVGRRILGWTVLALLVLLGSGCGGSRPQRTLSARQVVSALRQHGVPARITWHANEISGAAAMNGFLGFSGARLREHWGVTAFVQASFDPLNAPASAVGPPYLDVLVTDTARHAQGLVHRA